MRVAVVCPYSVSVPGGVQGQALALAGALAGRGHEVVVAAPSDSPGRPAGLAAAVGFVAAGRSLRVPVNGSVAPVSPFPAPALRALRAVRAFRPDVVHVHEPFVPGVAAAAVAARLAPTVGTFHRAGAGAGYRVLGPLARLGLRRLDDAVAVSDEARATLAKVVGIAGRGIDVVPNGVATARFAAAVPHRSGRPAVVFAGRHEQRKGLAVLLDAFGRLPDGAGAELWVVGEGPETASLRAAHPAAAGGGPVEWCGALDDGELAARLAGAAVLAAPSLRGESFGVVLLEAMAAGAAVVASDLPGYRLAAGDAAVFVPPGDPAALAGALGDLLGDPGRREALVGAGRERAAAHDIDRVAGAYLDRYARLLD